MNIIIKSLFATIHDTSFGGYPFKVVATIEVDAAAVRALKGDLGQLVVSVNNTVYEINRAIPAHNPSVDSQGSKKSKNGIKTMEFVYFFRNAEAARKLCFEFVGKTDIPRYYQYINLLKEVA